MKYIKGTHLTIDGYVGCEDVFSQPSVFELIYQLVSALSMSILTEPVAKVVPINSSKLESEEDEGGISYFCMITTSHIALHVWPLRQAFMMDIFSCVPFDTKLAENIVCSYLDVTHKNSNVLFRTDPKIEIKYRK